MISRFIKWHRLALSAHRLNAHLAAENLALRQQLGMYERREKKPRFNQRDHLFWVILYRFWSGWCNALQILHAFPWDTAPRMRLEAGVRRLEEEHESSEERTYSLQPQVYSLVGCHMIILNETHLKSILKKYFAYYHDDRTHYNLGKDTPSGRPVQSRPSDDAEVIASPRLGGLHHRYAWRQVA